MLTIPSGGASDVVAAGAIDYLASDAAQATSEAIPQVAESVSPDVATTAAAESEPAIQNAAGNITSSANLENVVEPAASSEGESVGSSDLMATVRHYTSWIGREGIEESGAIESRSGGFVYVVEPSEVEGLSTPEEVATRLGLDSPAKAVTYFEFQYPYSRLVDLGLTSGGAQQLGIRGYVYLNEVTGTWWP